MKLSMQTVTTMAAVALLASSGSALAQKRMRVERAPAANAAAAWSTSCPPATSFSTEVPLVQRYSPPGSGNSNTLVLNAAAAHPFNVTLLATNQHNNNQQGAGLALPQTDVFGYFSFPTITGNASNPEVFIKILDARTNNGFYWVFFGGLTDLQYTLTVTEVPTGRVKQYSNPPGSYNGGADVTAFSGSSTVSTNLENTQVTPNAFVRTAVDIANNVSGTITADIQYAYTCTHPSCSPVGSFYLSPIRTLTISGLHSFHSDDIVQYLGSQGLLQTGADQGSTGTFLVTFNNLPSTFGWEGSVSAHTYNRISEPDPLRGTVGFGENASIFFESTNTSLVGTAIDTRSSPTTEGSLLTQVGIRNTDINNTGNIANVDLSCYDPSSGLRVGNTLSLTNIRPGEVRLVPDLFAAAAIPSGTQSVIVFADTHIFSSTAPTIEGFLLTQDTISLDTRFNELRCADLAGICGPQPQPCP